MDKAFKGLHDVVPMATDKILYSPETYNFCNGFVKYKNKIYSNKV